MSLDRFSNKEEILQTNGVTRGIVWNADDVDSLILDVKTVTPDATPTVEIHVYSPSGDYINSVESSDFEVRRDKLFVNYASALADIGIRRGFFEIAVNVHEPIFGNSQNKLLQIKEISPDRRELLVRLVPLEEEVREQYVGAVESYLSEYANTFQIDLAVNFGKNNIIKIINQKDWDGEEDMVMRLYTALPESVQLNDTFWIVEELADSYIDNVDISIPLPITELNILRGPNFDIDSNYSTITETEFKTWNDLLGTNLSTSQQIIDRYFSGSLSGVPIGVDYTAFDNFVFYSSAYERLANFKYKMELLEFYNKRINILNGALGSDSGSLANNISITRQRIDNVIGSFDGFERWLYYEPTASLSTHGTSGSFIGADGYALTPWPKYLSASQYYVHHTTSSIATTWYDGFSATASAYDVENGNALIKTIPEHIRNDVNNDQYELFVNMIGHHFDILYTYVEALTKTYRPEEQPKLGVSRESLYEVAKSMGWTLANGNQATALWQYKLGVNTSGSYQSTGSLFSKTNEEITTEIWRRIVNNLPFLLKTKGTGRSIKALMNAYGIPQTLLSIREYGGPKVEETVPTLIEDRYAYMLEYNNINISKNPASLAIKTHNPYSSSIGTWGIRRGGPINGFGIAPMTREWRFKPSTDLVPYYTTGYGNQVMTPLATIMFTPSGPGLIRTDSAILLQWTGSYSGSNKYGRILYGMHDGVQVVTGSSNWVPLFDGDMWNIRWWWETKGDHFNTGSNIDTTYYVQVQKASDYITGKIIHSASLSILPIGAGSHVKGWATPDVAGFAFGTSSLMLGSAPGADVLEIIKTLRTKFSVSNVISPFEADFIGYFQEYREWLETLTQEAFNEHTLNPTSYVSGISPTSSYDTLIRHYTFGSDTIAYRSIENGFISSSHPANTIKDFSGKGIGSIGDTYSTFASDFSNPPQYSGQLAYFAPIEETYYVQGVSLGGSLPRSEKIRLEDNFLIRRLSPTNTAERSSFDYAPIDTNRLGLFYSHADQINKDIFNQIGDIALDDFVGDPNDEFEYQYPDLFHFSKNYWKKYTDRNDINAYIRIFSQFDFSLFNQIKQLLPERVDEAMGLLIEPHALERVKVPLTKRPVIENPQYDVVFTQSQPTASGEYIMYSASIAPVANLLHVESVYHTGSNGYSDIGNTWFANTDIGPTQNAMDYCTIEINPVDALPSGTASIIDVFTRNTGEGTWTPTGASNLKDAIDISETAGSTYISITSNFFAPGPQLLDDLYIVFNSLSQFDINTDIILNAWHLRQGGADYPVNLLVNIVFLDNDRTIIGTTQNYNTEITLTATPTNTQIILSDIKIPAYTYYTACKLRYSIVDPTVSPGVVLDAASIITNIREVCHSATMPIIDSYRTSNIYQQVVYHYSGSNTGASLRDRNAFHAYSQSLGLFYSQSLITAPYMDDFFEQTENLFYNGCRITAPDINVNSTIAALGNLPIIEVFNTNPNQLIFTQTPAALTPGNDLESGNLIVQ